MKINQVIAFCGLFAGLNGFAQTSFDEHLIEITTVKDSATLKFVKTPDLFEERWDTLAQPNFWKRVMKTPPDSCVLNVMKTRQILEMQSVAEWNKQSDDEKEAYRDTLRVRHGLAADTRIFMTTGKSDFFQFDLVFPSINRGIEVFAENETDPWYAQAILMIESPGKIAYSNAGALGPFQLMKSVARNHGLRVDSKVDERKDFDKSAKASAHLIRTGCIPEGKRIMRKFGIEVAGNDQYDLWFRLLVLHIYHAGAGNVENVMTHVVKPKEAGGNVIQTIWHSEYGNFKNSSQNYSQLALAAMLVLDDLIYTKCSSICEY
ncbi:MAG: transglycosylase SLT domain-containing protein [Crocinitomicaceae bacterium]|nr:transglycosylase SLT domain-containing protein [Crocinitomicaceae bacterium]